MRKSEYNGLLGPVGEKACSAIVWPISDSVEVREGVKTCWQFPGKRGVCQGSWGEHLPVLRGSLCAGSMRLLACLSHGGHLGTPVWTPRIVGPGHGVQPCCASEGGLRRFGRQVPSLFTLLGCAEPC